MQQRGEGKFVAERDNELDYDYLLFSSFSVTLKNKTTTIIIFFFERASRGAKEGKEGALPRLYKEQRPVKTEKKKQHLSATLKVFFFLFSLLCLFFLSPISNSQSFVRECFVSFILNLSHSARQAMKQI